MARIRCIKPDFPQSESMGRVSRDARLLFIQLWTICDDSGRTRGNSRILASLLFPYDDDSGTLIDSWLEELEGEGCVVRYEVEGSTYLQIRNWLKHQKIDKPSPSKIPKFDEHSRIFAKPREFPSLEVEVDKERDMEEEGNGILEANASLSGSQANADDDAPEKGERIPYQRIINSMNAVLFTSYRVTDIVKRNLRARWREGFRENDFTAVCERKLAEWGNDTKMAQFLRPETLFGSKMGTYLGARDSLPRTGNETTDHNLAVAKRFVDRMMEREERDAI